MPDLRTLRSSLAAFAAEIAHPLAEWQAEDLRLEAPITCLLWGRQMGKSRALGLRALWRAFGTAGVRVLVVSGGGELGARRLLAEVRGLAAASPLLRGSVADEGANLLQLSNGSEIRCVAASESAIRGWAADELYVDEAQLVPDSLLFGAALPTTSAREGARVVLAGTASVASGGFFDLFRQGEVGAEHVRSSRRVSRLVGGDDHAPWQEPSMVEAQVAAIGRLRADAEHRCVWASGADTLVSRATVDRAKGDYLPLEPAELLPSARFLAGVDWGATTDRSAMVVVGRVPGAGRRVFGVACARRWPAGHPLHEVVEEIATSPAHFATLVAETNGLGAACAQLLWRRMADRPQGAGGPWKPPARRSAGTRDGGPPTTGRSSLYAPTARSVGPRFATRRVGAHVIAPMKATAYSALRLLLEDGRLILPASSDLVRELLMLRVDLAPGGTERVEASVGHDDLADALALSTVPYRAPDGSWRTVLSRLAETARPLPTVASPRLPGPTVSTGGGLELARRPAWQSVAAMS